MSIATFEGFVEQGQIKLKNDLRLPDQITVYIIVPDLDPVQLPRIHSPHLLNPQQAQDFVMEVSEVVANANV